MKSDGPADARYFRPNWRAYAALILVTVVLAAMYRLGVEAVARLGQNTVLGGSRSTLLLVEVVLCGAVWLYVAEHLLRRYEADQSGLTIYRLVLPPLRFSWGQVDGIQVYGYGDGMRLTLTGQGHLLVMLECLQNGAELGGYVQRMAGGFRKARR